MFEQIERKQFYLKLGIVVMAVLVFTASVFWFRKKQNASTNLFVDVTTRAGLGHSALTFGNPAVGDINGDGFPDIFIGNHGVPPKMYLNNRNGTFSEMIDSELEKGVFDRHGMAWCDIDNDGDLDLYLTTGAKHGNALGSKHDQLYRNDGEGHFSDISDRAGISNSSGRGRSVNCVDYDNDGFLDIFVQNFRSPNMLYHNNRNGTFTNVADSAGVSEWNGERSTWADFDNDGDMDLLITGGGAELLRNDHGIFHETTPFAGIRKNIWNGTWGDYDNDGDLDLYLNTRQSAQSRTYILTEKVIVFFENESKNAGMDFTTSTPTVVFDVYLSKERQPLAVYLGSAKTHPQRLPVKLSRENVVGQPQMDAAGIYLWSDEAGWHVHWNRENETETPLMGKITTDGTIRLVDVQNLQKDKIGNDNFLFNNRGNGRFEDVTEESGIVPHPNGQAAIWGDYDNDGWLDLYQSCAGTILKNDSGILFHNEDGHFKVVPDGGGIHPTGEGRGDGSVWFDYDRNGWLDLLLTNGAFYGIFSGQENQAGVGPYQLYRNVGSKGHWLEVHLIGTKSNKMGLGARVTVHAGSLTMMREMFDPAGGSFYTQGAGPLHFGLGGESRVDALSIQWPSGVQQKLSHIPADQILTIVENSTQL